MIIRSILTILSLVQLCSASPMVSWGFSKAENYPHNTPLKGMTLVSQQHAQTDSSISVSHLTAGGALNASTYQSQADSLNLATFRKNGESGYLEFSLTNESAKKIDLESIVIEVMPNGPNSPKSLEITISCDGDNFRKFGSNQLFPSPQQKVFSSLNFSQAVTFKKNASIRIQSPTTQLSTGNLHFRKLIVHKKDGLPSLNKGTTTTFNNLQAPIPATLIHIGGISLQLR